METLTKDEVQRLIYIVNSKIIEARAYQSSSWDTRESDNIDQLTLLKAKLEKVLEKMA